MCGKILMYTGGHKIVIDGFDGQTYTATLENRVDALEGGMAAHRW